MHQKFNPHRHSGVRRHVHAGLDIARGVVANVEDRLQDISGRIRDVGILPVKRDGVSGGILVPKVQVGSRGGRDYELLIERAVA